MAAALATLSEPTRPSWGMNATASHAPSSAGRQPPVLVAEGQAHVAVEVRLVQRHGRVGELDADDRVAVGLRRLGRPDRVLDHVPRQVALGAEGGATGALVARLGGRAREPQVVDPERGGGADDGPDVERGLHAVEEQGDPPVGPLPPAAVEALEIGAAELLHR